MNPLRCLLVDDEPLAHGVIENYAARLPGVEIVATCLNTASAREALHAHKIDLMFLDIQMPRMTGLHFLDQLENPPLAILTTAYEDYALQGYDLDVVDYLLKPFEFERFEQAIAKAELRLSAVNGSTPSEKIPSNTPSLLVRCDGTTQRVSLINLCYVQAMGDYTKLGLCDGRVLCCHQPLHHWEEILPGETFIRIHRSYILSLNCVEEVTANYDAVTAHITIPISRSHRRDFTTALQKHQKRLRGSK